MTRFIKKNNRYVCVIRGRRNFTPVLTMHTHFGCSAWFMNFPHRCRILYNIRTNRQWNIWDVFSLKKKKKTHNIHLLYALCVCRSKSNSTCLSSHRYSLHHEIFTVWNLYRYTFMRIFMKWNVRVYTVLSIEFIALFPAFLTFHSFCNVNALI